MNLEDIQKQLASQQQALTKIYTSVEKTRKYFLWSAIGSLVVFVLPLIVMGVMLPRIIGTLTGGLEIFNDTGVNNQILQIESLSDTLNSIRELGF